MFAAARLQTIVCCADLDRARAFYRDVLGLTLRQERFNGAVFDAGGSALWVCPVPDFTPYEHTQFGLEVPDLAAAIARLGERGLAPHRTETMPHRADGSVTAPDGGRIAWFRDPDGNFFSLVQLPA